MLDSISSNPVGIGAQASDAFFFQKILFNETQNLSVQDSSFGLAEPSGNALRNFNKSLIESDDSYRKFSTEFFASAKHEADDAKKYTSLLLNRLAPPKENKSLIAYSEQGLLQQGVRPDNNVSIPHGNYLEENQEPTFAQFAMQQKILRDEINKQIDAKMSENHRDSYSAALTMRDVSRLQTRISSLDTQLLALSASKTQNVALKSAELFGLMTQRGILMDIGKNILTRIADGYKTLTSSG
jgi:hypothetical protein